MWRWRSCRRRFSTNKMYWQRDLPHYVPDGAAVFVTWRLAGTLPMPKSALLTSDPNPGKAGSPAGSNGDRPSLAERPAYREHRGFGSAAWRGRACFLRSALLGCDAKPRACRTETASSPGGDYEVVKGGNGQPRANRILGVSRAPFWQREYYDHWIRTEKEFFSIVHYIEQNPVVAGLAVSPEDWPWSSAAVRRRPRPPAPHGLIGVIDVVQGREARI